MSYIQWVPLNVIPLVQVNIMMSYSIMRALFNVIPAIQVYNYDIIRVIFII